MAIVMLRSASVIAFILLLVDEALLFSPVSSPFAARRSYNNVDQFLLWPNDTTLKTQLNFAYIYPCAFPVVYDSSYTRSLALAGFQFQNGMQANFTANMLARVGTTENIAIQLKQPMGIYQISYYILLVSTPQFCVWSLVRGIPIFT